MDWNILLSFALGAITTIIPIIITNRYQAREKDKDREEARREAKIQAREKWFEMDILKLMDSIENILKLNTEFKITASYVRSLQQEIAEMVADERPVADRREKLDKENEKSHLAVKKLSDAMDDMVRILDGMATTIFSLEDKEIREAYKKFIDVVTTSKEFDKALYTGDDFDEQKLPIRASAGKLHNLLREKLISLRE